MISNTKPVLIVAGEGGHLAQAIRFVELAKGKTEFSNFHMLLEASGDELRRDVDTKHLKIFCGPDVSKFTKYHSLQNAVMLALGLARNFFAALVLLRRSKPAGVIAFGPAFCLPVCMCARLLGVKVVYVETWSKFYSKTRTGALMEFLANRVYVQNKTLLAVYRHGRYAGRL